MSNYIGMQAQSGSKFETSGINSLTGAHKGPGGGHKDPAHEVQEEPTNARPIRDHGEPTRARPRGPRGAQQGPGGPTRAWPARAQGGPARAWPTRAQSPGGPTSTEGSP